MFCCDKGQLSLTLAPNEYSCFAATAVDWRISERGQGGRTPPRRAKSIVVISRANHRNTDRLVRGGVFGRDC